jgi:aspartate-semialdehyde dehydrogenase
MDHRIALSHASGVAAEAILEKLSQSGVAPDSLILLDHEDNVGKQLSFAGKRPVVLDQGSFDFSACALLLMPEPDAELAAAATAQGCLLLSHAIDSDGVPIVLMNGAPQAEISYTQTSLRLPGPELSCLLPVLLELGREHAISRLGVTLLRSAEFHGRAGVEELAAQTINLFNSKPVESRVYERQIAFNLLPAGPDHVLAADLRQILGNNSFSEPPSVALQSVDVPIFHGLAAAVRICFDTEVEIEGCKNQLSRLDKVIIKDGLVTPVSDCNQSFSCVVSRLEQAADKPTELQFWMLADPMRYGLANNYVNVADFLLKSFL